MALHLKLLLLVALLIAATKAEYNMSKSNCQNSRCGSITIPFPFGLTKECSLNPSFLITCNRTSLPHSPFWEHNDDDSVRVLNISLNGELHISLPASSDCYDNRTGKFVNGPSWENDLRPFYLSPMRNKLTVVGVDTAGLMAPLTLNTATSQGRHNYTGSVCLSVYNSDLMQNGSCTGFGCCETQIPQALSSFYYSATTNIINNTYYNNLLGSYPCGYAFLVEDGAYNFSSTQLLNFPKTEFPVVLDWAVGNHTCQEARKNASTYACKSDYSVCRNAKEGTGYLCHCSPGYRGNPYLLHDIDECSKTNDCVPRAKCNNVLGSYNCSCPSGYEGDGKKKGVGCQLKSKNNLKTYQKENNFKRDIILITTLSVSVGILALLGGGFYVYWALKKRRLIKLKEQFFQQNGGILLQQQIAKYSRSTETTKVFTVEELEEATNNFDEGMVLGRGGQGTVYKGELPNNKIVAIKRSKISNLNQVEQFINEVIVLSQINHRNVVKLLGCCLETEVPLLVYEFIPNGTVYEHLHNQRQSLKLTWKTRLEIATESAAALAYLHSATSAPIIHRDVKTANILLDHNLTAKVSDFGASKIIPLDQTQLTTLVQGTLGYLDPEYFHTSQLTKKSDVYSFGVVLAELLTGKKALSFDGTETHRNLAMHFDSSMKEGRLLHIVDSHIIDEANVEQLKHVANIAKHCLRLKGEERPTMKEVATELDKIRVMETHRWESVDLSSEETENLLKATPSTFSDSFNILNQISWSLSSGR